MVYSLRSPAEAASYETAFKLMEVSRLLIRPAAMVFFPLCSVMAAQFAWEKLRRTATNLVLVTTVSGSLLGAAMAAISPWVMATVWGPVYADSGGVLRILCLSIPVLWVGLIGSFLAGALGREKQAAMGHGLSLLVNLGMNAAVVPLWGAVGAAWTTLAAQGVFSVWLILLVRKSLTEASKSSRQTSPNLPN
jgi:O-antigen/teichoic acid export membrane protein